MKKFTFLLIAVAALFLISCDENVTPIVPSDISNITTEARPGAIFFSWDRELGSYESLWIRWFDPLIGQERFWVSSNYADTLLIPNTRARYGEYTFTFQTQSSTGTFSNNIQTVRAVSGPAPSTFILDLPPVVVPLTCEQLSTNAPQAADGIYALCNILNSDDNTLFHSRWSSPVPPGPHWFQVDLERVVDTNNHFSLWFRRRMTGGGNNNANRPTDIDLMGSMDGDNWFLLRNFTAADDGLPTVNTVNEWRSPNILVAEPFRYIRFSVNETNTGTVFFTMSSFRFYVGTITVIDPEADGK